MLLYDRCDTRRTRDHTPPLERSIPCPAECRFARRVSRKGQVALACVVMKPGLRQAVGWSPWSNLERLGAEVEKGAPMWLRRCRRGAALRSGGGELVAVKLEQVVRRRE